MFQLAQSLALMAIPDKKEYAKLVSKIVIYGR